MEIESTLSHFPLPRAQTSGLALFSPCTATRFDLQLARQHVGHATCHNSQNTLALHNPQPTTHNPQSQTQPATPAVVHLTSIFAFCPAHHKRGEMR